MSACEQNVLKSITYFLPGIWYNTVRVDSYIIPGLDHADVILANTD